VEARFVSKTNAVDTERCPPHNDIIPTRPKPVRLDCVIARERRRALPHELASTPDEQLRGVGLSRQKLSYLKDLAARVASSELAIETLHDLPDDEVIETLVRVKGVGRWTAQMFLMFRLGRPDVLPELDLGIQNAVQRAYRLRKRPTPERVRKIGAPWAPYRTVASWYLWRSLELPQ
jgi:DNA-3-methyladenine glycosylase II